MRVIVRPMRLKGRNLPRAQCLAQPGTIGELSVCEWRDPELGRCLLRAQFGTAWPLPPTCCRSLMTHTYSA